MQMSTGCIQYTADLVWQHDIMHSALEAQHSIHDFLKLRAAKVMLKMDDPRANKNTQLTILAQNRTKHCCDDDGTSRLQAVSHKQKEWVSSAAQPAALAEAGNGSTQCTAALPSSKEVVRAAAVMISSNGRQLQSLTAQALSRSSKEMYHSMW